LIVGPVMPLWLFGVALPTWYGSRRTEPLRRPAFIVFITLSWVLALMMPGMALRALIGIPPGAMVGASMAIILCSVVYLIKKNRDSRGPLDSTPNECWQGG